jgi:sugar lactone lactonase YvrE
MKDIQIRCIADTKCTLGEGPVWDEKNQVLYWVDILENKVFRHDPSSEAVDWWKTPEHVGFIILKEGDGLLAGLKTGLHHVALQKDHSVSVSRIDRVDEHKDHIRFNDGICDQQGRIWGCTMDMRNEVPLGKYYCYDGNLNRTIVDEGYVVANGPALSPEGQFLYTVETVGGPTLKKGIYVAASQDRRDFHAKKLVVDWRERPTLPDGVITDEEGNLWIGEFGGNTLRCYSSEGILKHEIVVPAWSITKAVFGGKDRNILYVTTARYGAEENILKKYPQTGGIFEIRGMGVKGQPSAYFKW